MILSICQTMKNLDMIIGKLQTNDIVYMNSAAFAKSCEDKGKHAYTQEHGKLLVSTC